MTTKIVYSRTSITRIGTIKKLRVVETLRNRIKQNTFDVLDAYYVKFYNFNVKQNTLLIFFAEVHILNFNSK